MNRVFCSNPTCTVTLSGTWSIELILVLKKFTTIIYNAFCSQNLQKQSHFSAKHRCRSLRPWQTKTHCCRHIVSDTNVSPFAYAGNICCGHKFCVRDTKNVFDLFRNILCPQQMFPSLRSPRNIMSNNVSTTMCPRLPGPLHELNRMQMRKILCSPSLVFDSAHMKHGVWTEH